MSRRVFFVMRWHNGTLTPVTYQDEFNPSKEDRATTHYACRLPAAWYGRPLADLVAAYHQHAAMGTLPPSIIGGQP